MSPAEADQKTWRGSDQGSQLKSTTGWNSSNGTNTTGFTALPGGFRTYNQQFIFMGDDGYWWTGTEENDEMAWIRGMSVANNGVYRDFFEKSSGLAVRCVKN